MQKVIIKLACVLALALLLPGWVEAPKAYAGSNDLTVLGEEQADEKQELENMKQELGAIKSNINGGLQGLSKIDTSTLKDLQEFHLFCKTALCEISPGKIIDCYTYNGILPGPIIRVKEGQLVRLIVHNQLNTATSLDLHGMVLPSSVDELPNAQSGLIKPGQTYAYQFIAKPLGTYWYHPQIMHCDQKAKGMYGALIVEPAGQPVKSVDQDITLILSDMAVTKNENQSYAKPAPEKLPASGQRQTSLFARSANNYSHRATVGQTTTADASSANHIASMPAGRQPQSVFYLVNGKTAPDIPAIEVSRNSRIRLRMINSGQHAVPLHITGHKFELISLNGDLIGEQTARDTITLGVSDRADLEFTANNPGIWTLGSELIEQSTSNGKFPGGIAFLLRYINE